METDALIDSVAQKLDELAAEGFQRLLALLDHGLDPRGAIDQVMRSFEGQFAEQLRGAFSDLLQRNVGRAELLALPVSDTPLSARLYAHSEAVSREVVEVIRQHAAGVQQARGLAMSLYDGYDPRDGIRRPLEGRARGLLPAALRAITQDIPTRRSLTQLLEDGQKRAAKLKTPALRAAYSEAFTAWSDGDGKEALDRRLDIAVREKNRFFAQRIAVTELARVNAAQQARELMADPTVDVVEVRINPTHPVADICDLHARADLWDLGPGCYPKAKAPQPTYHPFCRCRLRSRPDLAAAGARERSPADYLRRLQPGQAARVMGSQANADRVLRGESVDAVMNEGRDPAYHLRRLGDPKTQAHDLLGKVPEVAPPAPAPQPAAPPAPRTLDDFITAGRAVTSELPDAGKDPAAAIEALLARMKAAGINGQPAKFKGTGAGAGLVRRASAFYPSSWNDASDAMGPLTVRADRNGRGWQWNATEDRAVARLPAPFGLVKDVKRGQGFLSVRTDDMGNAVHEYAHRLQGALPALDTMFQDLHKRRTAGDPLRRLRDLHPGSGYSAEEVTREDSYVSTYQGKEYRQGGALEVMTMAFEHLLGAAGGATASHGRALLNLQRLWEKDREMYDLAVGLLMHWKP